MLLKEYRICMPLTVDEDDGPCTCSVYYPGKWWGLENRWSSQFQSSLRSIFQCAWDTSQQCKYGIPTCVTPHCRGGAVPGTDSYSMGHLHDHPPRREKFSWWSGMSPY